MIFVSRETTVLLKLPDIVHKNKGGQVWRVCSIGNVTGENICHWWQAAELPARSSEMHKGIASCSRQPSFAPRLWAAVSQRTGYDLLIEWIDWRDQHSPAAQQYCFVTEKVFREARTLIQGKIYETSFQYKVDIFRWLLSLALWFVLLSLGMTAETDIHVAL